jgi:hypothetical protein
VGSDRYNRKRTIGWYGDFDQQVYRQEALVIAQTGSAQL